MAFYDETVSVWINSRLGELDRMGTCWYSDYNGPMLTSVCSQKRLFRGN